MSDMRVMTLVAAAAVKHSPDTTPVTSTAASDAQIDQKKILSTCRKEIQGIVDKFMGNPDYRLDGATCPFTYRYEYKDNLLVPDNVPRPRGFVDTLFFMDYHLRAILQFINHRRFLVDANELPECLAKLKDSRVTNARSPYAGHDFAAPEAKHAYDWNALMTDFWGKIVDVALKIGEELRATQVTDPASTPVVPAHLRSVGRPATDGSEKKSSLSPREATPSSPSAR